MKILFIHPNFPGQFKHLAAAFGQDKNNQVLFACRYDNKPDIKGVTKVKYRVTREPSKDAHRYLIGFEQAVCAGQAVYRLCEKLKKSGFTPDVIVSHSGWGEGLFLKDVLPDTPLINYMEFYYHAFGADMYFDPEEEINPDAIARTRIRNTTHLLNLEACDWAISPTKWQGGLHPKEFHHKMSIIHEGIDTDLVKPADRKSLTLPNGKKLTKDDEIVTYVARNFEPYRGFPQTIRAIELILKKRPKAQILIVGADGVSYGKKLDKGKTYKQIMLDEVNLDNDRVHWLGSLPFDQYLKVLQFSDAHIYLTVPFVLSWSSLEALATGCIIVASDTAPVREVIKDGKNGFLVDFFKHKNLANKVCDILENKGKLQHIKDAARQTVLDNYSLKKILPVYMSLIKEVAKGKIPPPSAKKMGFL